MKALNKLQELSTTLGHLGIDHSDKEAELMIRHGLDMNLAELLKENPEIDEKQEMTINDMVIRRSSREPLQYILGRIDFLGLSIEVGSGVLIPRPETELMAEYAIKALGTEDHRASGVRHRTSILDLCTGSGCLALALAYAFPDSMVSAVDISDDALQYAQTNAESNNINNIKFFGGHLFEALERNVLFDFIISNPPYIMRKDIETLQPEIKDWEPLNALDGGEDGLDFYRQIIPAARSYLHDKGLVMFELGLGGADTVAELFQESGYRQISVIKDYAGIERIISAHKQSTDCR